MLGIIVLTMAAVAVIGIMAWILTSFENA